MQDVYFRRGVLPLMRKCSHRHSKIASCIETLTNWASFVAVFETLNPPGYRPVICTITCHMISMWSYIAKLYTLDFLVRANIIPPMCLHGVLGLSFISCFEFALCLDEKPTYCLGFGNCLIASYPSALCFVERLLPLFQLWVKHVCKAHSPHGKHARLLWTHFVLLHQEEEEEVPKFVAEDEIEESDLSDIEVSRPGDWSISVTTAVMED